MLVALVEGIIAEAGLAAAVADRFLNLRSLVRVVDLVLAGTCSVRVRAFVGLVLGVSLEKWKCLCP